LSRILLVLFLPEQEKYIRTQKRLFTRPQAGAYEANRRRRQRTILSMRPTFFPRQWNISPPFASWKI